MNADDWFKVLTGGVALAAFWVALTQRQIASARLRLDLYNKRFAIYSSAIKLHRTLRRYGEIGRSAEEFGDLYLESGFLFDPDGPIHRELFAISRAGIQAAIELQKFIDRPDSDPIKQGIRDAIDANARIIEASIVVLETHLRPYLDFRAINGWGRPARRKKNEPIEVYVSSDVHFPRV